MTETSMHEFIWKLSVTISTLKITCSDFVTLTAFIIDSFRQLAACKIAALADRRDGKTILKGPQYFLPNLKAKSKRSLSWLMSTNVNGL